MLERSNPEVAKYLDRAAESRHRAQEATDQASREFYEQQEATWMRLAASAALVVRVDLFLETRGHAVPPCDRCPNCAKLMMLRTVESSKDEQIYTFECLSCACTEQRRVIAGIAAPPVYGGRVSN